MIRVILLAQAAQQKGLWSKILNFITEIILMSNYDDKTGYRRISYREKRRDSSYFYYVKSRNIVDFAGYLGYKKSFVPLLNLYNKSRLLIIILKI